MTSKIFQISIYSADLASIVLALFSLLYCWRPYNPPYLRSFPVFTLINVFQNSLEFFAPALTQLSEVIFTLFEMLYFSYFLRKVLVRKRSRYVIGLFAISFIALYLFFVMKKVIVHAVGFLATVEAFFLCIGCLLYFREQMLDPVGVDLSKNPAFWMVTATIFYFALTIPSIFLYAWYSFKSKQDYALAAYSINNYAQVINSVLYIKGITCRKKLLS